MTLEQSKNVQKVSHDDIRSLKNVQKVLHDGIRAVKLNVLIKFHFDNI